MADITELIIRIRATAEDLEATLQSASQKVQQFARMVEQVSKVSIKLDVQTDGIVQAETQLANLKNTVSEAGAQTMVLTVDASAIQTAAQGMQALQAAAGTAADATASALEGVATAAAGVGTAFTEIGEKMAQGANAAIQNAGQLADNVSQVAEAVEKTGAQGQAVGTQAATRAATATAATKGWAAATEILNGALGEIGSTLSSMLITWAVNGIKNWIKSMVDAREEAERLRQETAKLNREAFQTNTERLSEFDKLSKRYSVLNSKTAMSVDEYRELGAIQRELSATYGVTTTTVDGLARSIDEYTEALKRNRQEQEQQLVVDATQVAQDSYLAAHTADLIEAFKTRLELQERVERLKNGGLEAMDFEDSEAVSNKFNHFAEPLEEYIKSLGKRVQNEETILKRHNALWNTWFVDAMDDMESQIQAKGGNWNEELAHFMKEIFTIDLTKFATEEEATAFVHNLIENVMNAAKNKDIMADAEGVKNLTQAVLYGGKDADEAAAEADGYLASLYSKLEKIFEGLDPEQAATATNFLVEALTKVNMAVDASKGTAAQQYFNNLKEGGVSAMLVGQELETFGRQVLTTDQTIRRAKNMTDLAKQWKEAKDELAKTTKGTDAWRQAISKANTVAKDFRGSVDEITGSTKDADEAFAAYVADLREKKASIVADIANLESQLYGLEDASVIYGEVTLTAEQARAIITALYAELDALIAKEKEAGVYIGGGGGGGGGGGKKKTKKELAEEARRKAEEARQEALRQDYELLSHKRHMNELTLEAELSMLEEIRRKHALNAKEIMEWEEKVFDLKKELRERDAGSIDKTGDALIDALAARYEAMQEAEIDRLDASRQAWEDWRDSSVKAIQDQIDALEELAQTEDREKQDQEELRKIARLRQDIEFEQDEYNRRKLQQQLDQAISSREDRLRRLDLQDQKDALRKQIEAIEEQTDAQLKAIDTEQEALEEAYGERLKSAALRAEAEKLIMTGTQQELIGLIGEFAPDYDALGKTLGEKLLEGFQSKVGDVVSWFQQLNDSLYAIQEEAAAQAISAANAFQAGYQERQNTGAAGNVPGTVVANQTVNFNQPVDSPSEAARKVQQANEALAEALLAGR